MSESSRLHRREEEETASHDATAPDAWPGTSGAAQDLRGATAPWALSPDLRSVRVRKPPSLSTLGAPSPDWFG